MKNLTWSSANEEGCTSVLLDVDDVKSLVQYLNLYIKYIEE